MERINGKIKPLVEKLKEAFIMYRKDLKPELPKIIEQERVRAVVKRMKKRQEMGLGVGADGMMLN